MYPQLFPLPLNPIQIVVNIGCSDRPLLANYIPSTVAFGPSIRYAPLVVYVTLCLPVCKMVLA